MENILKQNILLYLIGFYNESELIKIMDNILLNSQDYNDLVFEISLNNQSDIKKYLTYEMKYGKLKCSQLDFHFFSILLYNFFIYFLSQNNWRSVKNYVCNFIKIKSEILSFNGNDFKEEEYVLLDDCSIKNNEYPITINSFKKTKMIIETLLLKEYK